MGACLAALCDLAMIALVWGCGWHLVAIGLAILIALTWIAPIVRRKH